MSEEKDVDSLRRLHMRWEILTSASNFSMSFIPHNNTRDSRQFEQ